jgi:ubiquinone biosynthesis protein UbiJ
MDDDIVNRLRIVDHVYTEPWSQALMDEAADEIERLRHQMERLRHQMERLSVALEDISHLTTDHQVLHRIEEARRD